MLPRIQWTDFIPEDLKVSVRESDKAVDGNISTFELEIISKLVKFVAPEIIFEIGTFDGRTTLNLAAQSGRNAKVYTLDLPAESLDHTKLTLEYHDRKYVEKPQSGIRFHGTDVEEKIVQLYGDSASFDYGPFLRKVDLIFIDGSHSYEYVLSDSLWAMKMVRGGVIVWHDYASMGYSCWPGLVKALDELQGGNPAFRQMKHIADTALVVLVTSRIEWLKCRLPRSWRRRSTP
jgi:predicted O-methyltransferase YrrM